MKKLILLSTSVLFYILSFSQMGSNPTQGNANWNNHFLGVVTGDRGILAGTFTDTSAANLLTTPANIKGIPFLMINTSSDGKSWRRNSTATKWDEIAALDAVVTPTSTNTLTNKRWTARVGSTTSSGTPTINTDNYDIYKLTAQAADITSFTTNLSGTPVDGDILEIQITGTAARAITWGASFVSSTVTLPETTVTTATLTVILQYYTTSSYGNNKWVCVNSF